MRKVLFLCMVTLASQYMFADLNLIVTPLSGQEQTTALASIGYVRLAHDTMYVYSHTDDLLGQGCLSDVRKITFEDRPSITTGVDNISDGATIRVFPNPTHDNLIIENANGKEVQLFQLSGQKISTTDVVDGRASVEMGWLPSGTYLLLLDTQLIKIIKQ